MLLEVRLGSKRKSFPFAQNQTSRQYQGQRPTGQGQSQGQGRTQFQQQNQRPFQKSGNSCGRCGYWHGRNYCPAQDKTCTKCGRANHFAKCCRTSVSQQVYEMQNLEVSDDDFLVESAESHDEWKVHLEVNEKPAEIMTMQTEEC